MGTRGNTELGRQTKLFNSWEEVLAYVRKHGYVFYLSPMGHYASFVKAKVLGDTMVRVTPSGRDEDPFTAEADRLSYFRQPV